MNHWSKPSIEFLRKIVPELSGTPIYILRTDEHPVDWQSHWQACFSPLGDLKSQPVLQRLGLWAGRGVAITVRNDFETWSNRMQVGTLLHEMAHALEYLSQDNALCPMADLSPIARELLTGSESAILEEEGIDRNDLTRCQHGPQFVRLAMHLFWRARQQVVLSPSDLQILHGAYALGPERYEAVQEALSFELARSRNLDLTRLKEPPDEFANLFIDAPQG